MNITLPLLLLVLGGLSFWLLTESSLKWYIKTACIVTFCLFTILFWSTIHSFLGWPAGEDDMPEVVMIHWIVIKEPNKHTEFDGAMYFMIESAEEDDNHPIVKFFGYKKGSQEPRLFELPYDRELHERLQSTMAKLRKGVPVVGKLLKKAPSGPRAFGTNNKGKGLGDGSESQAQRWEFHELRPADFLKKPTD